MIAFAFRRGDSGQASVELVAVVPVMAIVLLGAWQTIVAGHAVWSVTEAARIGAREYAVQRRAGDEIHAKRRARRIATRVLPAELRSGASVGFARSGQVTVQVRVPLVFPFSEVLGRGPSFASRTRFAF